jgi:hypothetical protein
MNNKVILVEKDSPLHAITKDLKRVNVVPMNLGEKLAARGHQTRMDNTETERKKFMTMVASMFDDDDDHGEINPQPMDIQPAAKSAHPISKNISTITPTKSVHWANNSSESIETGFSLTPSTQYSHNNSREWSYEEAESFELPDVPSFHNPYDNILASIVASTQHFNERKDTKSSLFNGSSGVRPIDVSKEMQNEEFQAHFKFLMDVDSAFQTKSENAEHLLEKFLLLSTEDLQKLVLRQVSELF